MLEFVAKLDKADLRAAALKIATIYSISPAPPRQRAGEPSTKAPAATRKSTAPKPAPAPRAQPETPTAPDSPVNPPLTFELKLQAEHPYLAARGVSPELVGTFGLGYCNRGLMKGRICIPIHDEAGNLVAYAGRWADDGDPPNGEDKYKLPAKFQKSRVLFNLHRLPEHTTHVVLVEGFWSVFRLHALGVPVAGLVGWSISPEQIELLLQRRVAFITLLLDGDDAGYRGRERLLPLLADPFFVLAPKLPEGEKPDTLDETRLAELLADVPTI